MSRFVVLAALAAACTQSAADAGAEKFDDPGAFVENSTNTMSCRDCHDTGDEGEDGFRKVAYSLKGTVARERWWGGQELHLLDAVDQCVIWFMNGDHLDPEADASKQLYEYLLSITPDGSPTETLPATIVENIEPILLAGDATRGAALYEETCQHCHGDMHTGSGNDGISDFILPEDTSEYETTLPMSPKGVIVTEAIRHGGLFNVGNTMPPYIAERLSDQEIADILAALELSSTEL